MELDRDENVGEVMGRRIETKTIVVRGRPGFVGNRIGTSGTRQQGRDQYQYFLPFPPPWSGLWYMPLANFTGRSFGGDVGDWRGTESGAIKLRLLQTAFGGEGGRSAGGEVRSPQHNSNSEARGEFAPLGNESTRGSFSAEVSVVEGLEPRRPYVDVICTHNLSWGSYQNIPRGEDDLMDVRSYLS